MSRLMTVAGLLAAISGCQRTDVSADRAAVEATVRKCEEAIRVFDFELADSLMTPDARWIEDGSEHDVCEVPARYGDEVRYFEMPAAGEALRLFLEYAKSVAFPKPTSQRSGEHELKTARSAHLYINAGHPDAPFADLRT